jgi:hypothetical protein
MRPRVLQEPLITLEAQGKDAREVFAELFRQAGKPFALHTALERPLYLMLREVPFLRALQIVCEATDTRFAVREGVYLVLPKQAAAAQAPPRPANRVRLVCKQATLQQVARLIEAQAGVKIEVAPDVPALQFNLNLPEMEVETVLAAICRGTGLRWERTAQGYRIAPVEPPRLKVVASPDSAVRGAIRAPSAPPRSTPARALPPDESLKCPKCRYTLQLEWRYCPMCGAWVKPLTDRAKREAR